MTPKTVHNSIKKQENSVQNDSKYALGLLSLAKKCQNVRKVKEGPFNKLVLEQNRDFFGFLPLSKMPEKIKDSSVPHSLEYLEIHRRIRADGRPHFCGLQLPVPSKLNSEKIFHYLSDYGDWQIPLFIKFGFPLYVDRSQTFRSDRINHQSAKNFLSM